jgi:hypothetical protein
MKTENSFRKIVLRAKKTILWLVFDERGRNIFLKVTLKNKIECQEAYPSNKTWRQASWSNWSKENLRDKN